MSKIVRVRYFNHNGEETEEVCYLVENSDTIIPKTTIENDLTFDVSSLLPNNDTIMLEDSQGLWFLDKGDLISMVPATDFELSDYFDRN